MLLAIVAALLTSALHIFLLHRRDRVQGGLPAGQLIYSDTELRSEEVLLSRRHGLVGKPDALVRLPSGEVIPVERKRRNAPRQPYDADLAQATVYCILVEEAYGRTPPFMRVQYADRSFDEPYTPARKQSVLLAAEQIRRARRLATVNRSHAIAGKCRGCSQRQNCDQSLVGQ